MNFLLELPTLFGPVVATLFGLIALDVLLGVAVALRTGYFEWRKVAQFYQTNVIPFGLQALAVAAASKFITIEFLPLDPNVLLGVGIAPMFGNLIFGSILVNMKALALGVSKFEAMSPPKALVAAMAGMSAWKNPGPEHEMAVSVVLGADVPDVPAAPRGGLLGGHDQP